MEFNRSTILNKEGGGRTLTLLDLNYIVNGLLSGNSIIGIYWFFPVLYCIYLSLPLFASVSNNKRKFIFIYLLCIGFIVNISIPFIKTVFGLGFSWNYNISVISNYLFFVIEGYILYNYPPKKSVCYILYILAATGLIMHIIGTEILSLKFGEINSTFKGYCNIPCVLYSTGIFLLLCKIGKILERNKWINKLIYFLGKYTFALYIMHWYVIELIINITHINTKWIVYRLCFPFIIFAIVIGITSALRKLPFVKYIVP